MNDFSIYKLSDDLTYITRYVDRMGEKEFFRYQQRVFDRLDRMKAGDRFDVTKVIPENRELFIKSACQFILKWRLDNAGDIYNSDPFCFNEFYTEIKRL